jgi:hypothetical protein
MTCSTGKKEAAEKNDDLQHPTEEEDTQNLIANPRKGQLGHSTCHDDEGGNFRQSFTF